MVLINVQRFDVREFYSNNIRAIGLYVAKKLLKIMIPEFGTALDKFLNFIQRIQSEEF